MMQQRLFHKQAINPDQVLYSQTDNTFLSTRYQQQLEQVLQVAMVVLDLDFHIVHWNDQAEKLYGWKAEEVLGLPLGEILPADYQNATEILSLDLLQAEGKWEGEVVHKTRSGQKRYIHTSFHLIAENTSSSVEILMTNRNNSAKQEMKESMLKINQHLQFHIDNSPLAYIQWDGSFRVQRWSNQAAHIFGWTEEDVLGKTCLEWQFIHPDDQKEAEKMMMDMLAGCSDRCICNHRYFTKSGKTIYCEWYNSVVRNKQGKITSMLTLINDVTEKVVNKHELREVNQQLEHTLSSINKVIWRLTVSGDSVSVKYISPNIDQVTGYNSLAFSEAPQQWLKLIHPLDIFTYKKHLSMFIRGNAEHTELKYRIIDREGRVKWVLDQVSVEQKGDDIILSGSLKDITAGRELDKLVEDNERKIRHITETAPGVIFQFNRAKDGREWFDYLNTKSELLEISDGLVKSNTLAFWEQMLVEDRPSVQDALRQSEDQLTRFDCSFRVKNAGKIIWYRTVAEPMWHEEEQRTIWTGIIMDVTEQRHLVEQLENKNLELNNFAYRVSHDLRAPLSSVKGIVELAQMEENSPALISYLSMIESSIHRLDQFISNVLHHTKVANDQLTIEMVDFQKITGEILGDLDHMPAYSRIDKQIDISDNLDKYQSDPMLIMVILRNLISNGIKYHNPNHAHSYFKILITSTTQGIHIIYQDNGIGISQDKLSKVFDMFYRASDSAGGSGIGLFILKQAVEKLQGQLQIQSKLGEGTSFEITLPALEKDSED